MQQYDSQPNFQHLCKHFLSQPIALFSGSGVSRCDLKQYDLGNWKDLFRNLLVADRAGERALASFERARTRLVDEPWKLADWTIRRLSARKSRRLLTDRVREAVTANKSQLAGDFLDHAPTLEAVIAFCALLTGVVDGYANYRVGPNPRVRAVISTNYDPFLETASSTMFIKPLLKPVAAKGSDVGDLRQIPVFHIHGYVPARERPGKEPRVGLVLTSRSYRSSQRDSAYSPTLGPLIHYIRNYSVLFIGFSFIDDWINKRLADLNGDRKERKDRLYHYALLLESERNDKLLDRLGVRPIYLQKHCQIPDLLGSLHTSAARVDHGDRLLLPVYEPGSGLQTEKYKEVPVQYSWPILKSCRNRAVSARRFRRSSGSKIGDVVNEQSVWEMKKRNPLCRGCPACS